MMRRTILTVVAALGFLAGAVVLAPPANAFALIKCGNGRQPVFAAVDPIVNHNGQGAGHEHQFFGAVDWLTNLANPNTANYGDLNGHPTTCRDPGDTAGYWTPSLVYISGPNAGKRVPVQQFSAYYRPYTGVGKTGPGDPIPADTRLVSELGRYNWTCGIKSGARSTPVPAIPDCTGLSGKPGLTLTAHIDFPSCFDGVLPSHSASENGDTRDNAHWRYPVGKQCPASHPRQMIALRETLQFQYVGNGTDVALTSDGPAGTSDGRSLHGDFWQSWLQSRLEYLTRVCINSSTGPANDCSP